MTFLYPSITLHGTVEGHAEVVKALLSHNKKNIDTKDNDGTNALMAASVRGHREIVQLLIEAGAAG